MAVATHDEEVRRGAGGNPKSTGIIRTETTLVAPQPSIMTSMALMQCPSVLSAPTLKGHFYSLKAILQPPHTTEEVRCGARGHPKSTLIRTETTLVAP